VAALWVVVRGGSNLAPALGVQRGWFAMAAVLKQKCAALALAASILAFLLCCIYPPLEGVRSAVVGYSYGHLIWQIAAL